MRRCLLGMVVTMTMAQAQSAPATLFDRGDPVAVVFSPDAGYSDSSYLRRVAAGPDGWATPARTLVELLRRCPPGAAVRVVSDELTSPDVLDALLAVARDRGVEVKLLLAAAPLAPPAVAAVHDELARRADEYLRARAQRRATDPNAPLQGEVQVKLGLPRPLRGTFGVVALSRDHGPEHNWFFLGDGLSERGGDDRLGALLVIADPLAALRTWQEFAALWAAAGACATHVDGSPGGGPNATPETQVEVRVRGHRWMFSPTDSTRIRFSSEGALSEVLVEALDDASARLPQGEIVWLSQLGCGEPRLVDALLELARRRPDLTLRVLLPMSVAADPAAERLATGGENIDVRFTWSSHALTLAAGAPPQLPAPDKGPRPPTHRALLLGSQRLLMGTYTATVDARGDLGALADLRIDDDRAASAPERRALTDVGTELDAIWRASGVLISAADLYGPAGLFTAVAAASARPGFLETYAALRNEAQLLSELLAAVVAAGAPIGATELRAHVDVLVACRFATWFGIGYRRAVLAPIYEELLLANKPRVRAGL